MPAQAGQELPNRFEQAKAGFGRVAERSRSLQSRQPVADFRYEVAEVAGTRAQLGKEIGIGILQRSADDLYPRPIRRSACFLGTAAPQHGRPLAGSVGGQFLRSAGLADPGLARQHDHPPVSAGGLFESTAQYLELVLSPDEHVCRRWGRGSPRGALGARVLCPRRGGRGLAGDRDTEDMHRPGDVLDPLLAAVVEGNVQPVLDLVAYHAADADVTWFGQSFEAGGDIDTVAVDVALVEDHVAEIDSDAELDPAFHRHIGIVLNHRPLDFDGAAHRIDNTGKLDEQPVAGGLDDAAPMLLDLGIRKVTADRLQSFERAFLVGTHQPRIAGDVGG